MSYDIVRSIRISNNAVYFTSAPSNVRPRTFQKHEVPGYTKIYQKQGIKALLQDISRNVWNGNYRLQNGSKITNLLAESHQKLISRPNLISFLDDDHAAEFMAEVTARRLKDPSLSIHNEWVAMELAVLEGLRYDKQAVLDICKKNPSAFNFAAGEIYCNRDIAKEYIQQCSHMLLFAFPRYYSNDKELAMLALPQNGCLYRGLSSSLRADQDIIRMAFDQHLNEKRYFEHLPDLIPSEVREDKALMRELVAMCPSLHIDRAPDILSDLETTKVWAKNSRWVLGNLFAVPKDYLSDPSFQAVLLERFETPMERTKLGKAFHDLGVQLQTKKPSLSVQITGADSRKGEGQKKSRNVEKEL